MINEVTRAFLDALTWGYRRYNYWAGDTWLTSKLPITKENAIKLINNKEIIGIWQCFGDSIEEPCRLRDVLVFEVDIRECEGRESLDCVLKWARERINDLKPLLDQNPVVWWNGGKSLYFMLFFEKPVPADYVLSKPWADFAASIGMDLQEAQAKHAVRVLGTPHQRTGYLGKLLDNRLRPTLSLVINRVDPYYFLEPPSTMPSEPKPVSANAGERGWRGSRRLPRWVQALIDYLKENGELCHEGRRAIATWMLFLGYSEDEIVEVFRSAKDFNEHKTRYYIRYEYEKWISQGMPPISCKTVVRKCGDHKVPKLECGGVGS